MNEKIKKHRHKFVIKKITDFYKENSMQFELECTVCQKTQSIYQEFRVKVCKSVSLGYYTRQTMKKYSTLLKGNLIAEAAALRCFRPLTKKHE